MTESDSTEVDFDSLRKSRPSYQSAVTRAKHSLQRIMDEEDPSTLDLDGLKERLESLETTERRGMRTHASICSDDREEGELLDKDEEARDTFTDSILAVKALAKRLIAMRTAFGLTRDIGFNLDNLEELKARKPVKDHSITADNIRGNVMELNKVLRQSTIAGNHPLWQMTKELGARINAVDTKEAPTPTTSTTIISEPRSGKLKHTSLPKTSLPKFNGKLMEWTAYWERFRETVYENEEIPNSMNWVSCEIPSPVQ